MAHFSFASLTRVVLLLVFICLTTSSTGAAFSIEKEFLQLKENYVRIYLNLSLFKRDASVVDHPIQFVIFKYYCYVIPFAKIDSNETTL
jgi:hypothetical protein